MTIASGSQVQTGNTIYTSFSIIPYMHAQDQSFFRRRYNKNFECLNWIYNLTYYSKRIYFKKV